MKRYINFSLLILALSSFMACSNDDEPDTSKTVIPIDNENQTQFDKYLKRQYTDPYNIEFAYRYVDIESDMNYTLVPANYENSVKMANLVKYFCLDAYDAVAPSDFLKKYFPKKINLIGSFAYRNNGTIVLGTAEGGIQITLYGINQLNTNDVENLFDYYFRTIYHEFSHIMHQTIDYPNDFRKITASDYISDSWSNSDATEKIALEKGFVSRYSRKDPNEDFVELIAHYVTYSTQQWETMLTSAGTTGKPIIEQKMEMVKSYMLTTWKIDLDQLRSEIQERIANLPNVDLTKID